MQVHLMRAIFSLRLMIISHEKESLSDIDGLYFLMIFNP